MKTIQIKRAFQNDKQTLGVCTVLDEFNRPLFSAISLERGWLDNKINISCVPKGIYPVVFEYSPKFDKYLWELKKVPNRTECKFHSANFWYQLNGCIALGTMTKNIDKDGFYDISNSKNTMKYFDFILKNETKVDLIIT